MLQSLIKPPLRSLARSVRPMIGHIRDRTQRVEGLPTGLAFGTLDALCREHGRGRLKRCVHLHLSGWKARGTYRVELLTEAGTSCWRLIFKDECYRSEFIPALEGLPVTPGPPEAMLYRIQSPLVAPFLPRLLWFREIEPGRHYQYLLEDLAGTCEKLKPGKLPHMKVARGLVQLQQALRRAFAGKHHDGLILYDRKYSERLLDYAESNLAEYQVRRGHGAVEKLLDRWRDVTSVHQREEFYDDELRVPIHGDFNGSNIYIHRDNKSQLKVVDWEWAGVGLPHADLAALINSVNRNDHVTLLNAFVEEDRGLDAEQHWRLFHWCELERNLLDAGFLAKQELASPRRVPWLRASISRRAGGALVAVDRLGATRARAAA